MHVATPTKDCMELVNELLVPIIKARSERCLTRQEVSLFVIEKYLAYLCIFFLLNLTNLVYLRIHCSVLWTEIYTRVLFG